MVAAPGNSPLDFGVHDPSRARTYTVKHTSRIVTILQALGSLIGIPVGLVSAYSIYHGNFTAEAQCQTLRANIIAMLDKNADPTTLRMLVGRDVVTFESQCAAVDPDAVKAFKSLLTAKSAPVPEAPKQAAKEPPQKPVAKVAEPVKQAAAPSAPVAPPVKPAPVKTAPPVETAKPTPSVAATKIKPAAEVAKPAPAVEANADAANADANWIASVRQALVHAPARQEPAAGPAPLAAPAVSPPRVMHEAPPSAAVAPALPEPVAVAAPPAPPPASDHPVPPGSIPEPQPMEQGAAPAERSWMSKVPILNRVVGN